MVSPSSLVTLVSSSPRSSPVITCTELQISAARVASVEGEEGRLRGWVSRLMGGGGGGSEGRVTLLPPLPEDNILRSINRFNR